MFVVIEVSTPGVLASQVRSFGPYETRELAKAARGRLHLDNWAAGKWSPPRIYVVEIEEAI